MTLVYFKTKLSHKGCHFKEWNSFHPYIAWECACKISIHIDKSKCLKSFSPRSRTYEKLLTTSNEFMRNSLTYVPQNFANNSKREQKGYKNFSLKKINELKLNTCTWLKHASNSYLSVFSNREITILYKNKWKLKSHVMVCICTQIETKYFN